MGVHAPFRHVTIPTLMSMSEWRYLVKVRFRARVRFRFRFRVKVRFRVRFRVRFKGLRLHLKVTP